ncbi:hypothetical protein, partial [Photobacterium alginatilyticum]
MSGPAAIDELNGTLTTKLNWSAASAVQHQSVTLHFLVHIEITLAKTSMNRIQSICLFYLKV